jgi:hypothetical protein
VAKTQAAAAPAAATGAAARRFRSASQAAALVVGGVTLALMIADVPLAGLARQSLDASGGSLPVWFSATFAVVGWLVAWRKPGNPLGWILLTAAAFLALRSLTRRRRCVRRPPGPRSASQRSKDAEREFGAGVWLRAAQVALTPARERGRRIARGVARCVTTARPCGRSRPLSM